MSAVQEAIGQRDKGLRRLIRWPWWRPLLSTRTSLIVYIFAVLGGNLAVTGWELAATPLKTENLILSSAALGLAGVATSITFHAVVPEAMLITLNGPHAWLTRPSAVLAAVGCAVLFAVVNTCVVAVAAHLDEPAAPLATVLWDRETLLLDLTESCVGILVAITCALSFLLLLVALPPVILLQRSLMHQQMAAAARTDPKTGLLNATAWQREADGEVVRALRSGTTLALLLVDVDHFKRVNDSHGHLIGDEVLRALAAELRQQVRESDVVGRFGGEEFTVLLPRTDAAGACRIAERLRSSSGGLSISAADARISVTVSIGVSVLGQHGNDLFELLAAADLALYRAKDAGRDRVRLYSPGAPGREAAKSEVGLEGDEATGACP